MATNLTVAPSGRVRRGDAFTLVEFGIATCVTLVVLLCNVNRGAKRPCFPPPFRATPRTKPTTSQPPDSFLPPAVTLPVCPPNLTGAPQRRRTSAKSPQSPVFRQARVLHLPLRMRRGISHLAMLLAISTSLSACGPIIGPGNCEVAGTTTTGVGGNVTLTDPSGVTRSESFASGSTGVRARSVGGTCASSACASGLTIVNSDENGPTVSLSSQGFLGPGPYDLSALAACVQRCPGCAGDPPDTYPYTWRRRPAALPPTACVPIEGTLTVPSRTQPARGRNRAHRHLRRRPRPDDDEVTQSLEAALGKLHPQGHPDAYEPR